MLRRLKDCSLYQQLVVPMGLVGAAVLFAMVYSAFQLQNSVAALGALYEAGETRLRSLEQVDRGIALYQALSLSHLASERATAMQRIDRKLAATRQEVMGELADIDADPDEHYRTSPAGESHLSEAIRHYFERIDQAIRLSTDFEKEAAYEVLTRTEQKQISAIRESIQEQIRHQFEETATSRSNLMAAATANLNTTIALGIGSGGLLLAIAFLVTRRITRRISRLLMWSQKVSAGDLTAPLVADSDDEVGRMTNAMGGMARSIQRAHGEMAAAKHRAEGVAESLRIYANAFENSGEAILISDQDNRIINVNSAFTEQTGYALEEVRGHDPRLLSSGNTPREVYRELWHDLQEKGFWQGELWDRKKSGEIYPKWTAISAIRGDDERSMFYIASFTDISERKEAQQQIEHLAHHDILTGLFNRFSLEERLEQSLALARRERQQVAVLFIDLDRFKNINDSLGHQVGDKLLIEVARRLGECVRESDIVARIGGDEFVVVLTGMNGTDSVVTIADKVLQQLSLPYAIDGKQLESSPSIGISVYPDDGDSADVLLKSADIAMYHAKDRGRCNYHFVTESMLTAANARHELEHELHVALEKGQFELYYQPQIRTEDGRIYGVEALLRWRHPERGMVPPDSFIPLAEETGLIHALGAWVLDEACRQLAAWKEVGIGRLGMAVNLSARQLQSGDLPGLVHSAMAAYGIDRGDLELEITETAAMLDPERAVQKLWKLRELGVRLAIDDFGTGYSSLSYLKRLPIQSLKLDRSFVGDIENDPNDAEISAATLALAHNLGLSVIAEGVETEVQRAFLANHRCDYLQGYLFSRPLPADELLSLLGEEPHWITHDTAGQSGM